MLPETLKHDTIYYWRVDEFDGAATHQGDVWSFETTASGDPNLVGWWPFEDGYLDISGNENHGRPINDANIVAVNTRPYAGTTVSCISTAQTNVFTSPTARAWISPRPVR